MKKKPLFAISLLLVAALLIFCVQSFFSEELEEHLGLSSAKFAGALFTAAPDSTAKKSRAHKSDSTAAEAQKFAALDTTRKKILFFGDSMLERLGPRLGAYAEENGHELAVVTWYSSSTEVWAKSGKAKEFIEKYKPNYVMVCLGGNELFISDIKQKRTKYVQQLLKEIGNRPYIWIGPPNWKDDTGFNEMVQALVPAGRVYLSYTPDQHYERAKDGAHPTAASAAKWMDRICRWVMTKSDFPIRLNLPANAKVSAEYRKNHCHYEYLSPPEGE